MRSYQCPLKDLLLGLHIFFLELNLTRPNWKVFLSSGPEPPSRLPSPTCTKHLSCQASGFQYLPVHSSYYPSQPRLYWSPGKKTQWGLQNSTCIIFLHLGRGRKEQGEDGFKNSTKTPLKIPKIFTLLSNFKLSTRFKWYTRCKKTLHSLTNVKEQHSSEVMFSAPNHHPKKYKTPQKDIRFTSSLFNVFFLNSGNKKVVRHVTEIKK